MKKRICFLYAHVKIAGYAPEKIIKTEKKKKGLNKQDSIEKLRRNRAKAECPGLRSLRPDLMDRIMRVNIWIRSRATNKIKSLFF